MRSTAGDARWRLRRATSAVVDGSTLPTLWEGFSGPHA